MILIYENASWQQSKALEVPENIKILPYTPEMKPIEQVWKEICKHGFSNRMFGSLEKIFDQLCKTMNILSFEEIQSITHRDWFFCDF